MAECLMSNVRCPYCNKPAKIVNGKVIYPHRPDLAGKKFWQCAACDAYVGCHGFNPRHGYRGIEPLGRLANRELRAAKMAAHAAFDPIWQSGRKTRTQAYSDLASRLGIPMSQCHIGLFDVEMCHRVIELCREKEAAQ